MKRGSTITHITAIAFAFALVLKAFVPMLASASAALQGIGVNEVCPVYGVTLVPPSNSHATAPADHQGHDDSAHAGHEHHGRGETSPNPPHDGLAHGSDHCALTALLVFACGSDPVAGHAREDLLVAVALSSALPKVNMMLPLVGLR